MAQVSGRRRRTLTINLQPGQSVVVRARRRGKKSD